MNLNELDKANGISVQIEDLERTIKYIKINGCYIKGKGVYETRRCPKEIETAILQHYEAELKRLKKEFEAL